MRIPKHEKISTRERQILDILCRHPNSTAREVQARLPDPPSNSAVRTLLRRMSEKQVIAIESDGTRYRYRPTRPATARNFAVNRVVGTFFDGSPFRALAALLDKRGADISDEEYEELARLIEEARGRGQ